jgi:hypothetical protein
VYLFCDPEDVQKGTPQPIQPWTDFWRPRAEAQSWTWKKINTLQEAQDTTAIINYSSGYASHPEGK